MDNQNQEMDEAGTSEWKQKMEAMQRLAKALENTSPPLSKNIHPNTLLPATQPPCIWLQKLKTLLLKKNIKQ